MVQLLYVVAAGLGVWGLVILISGELVAMLDIATGLFGSAAIVAGLAAVAGALNRISRQIHRLSLELPEPDYAPAAANEDLAFASAPATRALGPQAPEPAEEDEPVGPPVGRAAAAGMTMPVAAAVWSDEHSPQLGLAGEEPPPSPAIGAGEEPADIGEEPHVIRSGTLNGVLYRFFSDGSVEAVTAMGLRRFGSIEELRDAILTARERREGADESEEAFAGAPAAASEADQDEPPAAEQHEAEPEVVAAPPAEEPPAPEPPPVAPQPPPISAVPIPPPPPAIPEPTPSAGPVEPPPVVPPPRETPPFLRPPPLPPHPSATAGAEFVTPEPAPPPPTPEPAPAMEADDMSPERRLKLFEQNIWAATLAELRKPFEEVRTQRDGEGAGTADPAAPRDGKPREA